MQQPSFFQKSWSYNGNLCYYFGYLPAIANFQDLLLAMLTLNAAFLFQSFSEIRSINFFLVKLGKLRSQFSSVHEKVSWKEVSKFWPIKPFKLVFFLKKKIWSHSLNSWKSWFLKYPWIKQFYMLNCCRYMIKNL